MCDGDAPQCPDGADEMCKNPCVSKHFKGRHILKASTAHIPHNTNKISEVLSISLHLSFDVHKSTTLFTLKACGDDFVCIPVFWFCDGDMDCPHGDDEFNCTCEAFNMVECMLSSHDKNNTLCVPGSWVYCGELECLNWDDSVRKQKATSIVCNDFHADRFYETLDQEAKPTGTK